MDGDIDYSTYSRGELDEALTRIDRDRFPRNYANLIRESTVRPQATASPKIAPAAELTVAGKARTILAYSLSLVALGIAWGMVSNVARRILFGMGSEHQWGQLDARSFIDLLLTVAINTLVYRRLARRHARDFLQLGIPIAALNTISSLIFYLLLAPEGTTLEAWLIIMEVVFSVTVMLFSGYLFGALRPGRNSESQ